MRSRFDRYEIHGVGVDHLWEGLKAIGMLHHRHDAAIADVRAIIAANAASGFCWYKVPNTNELAASWDGRDTNTLWVEPGNVHVRPDVRFPLTVTGYKGGTMPMHHFPGVMAGTSGTRRAAVAATPLPCQLCMNAHEPDEDCY